MGQHDDNKGKTQPEAERPTNHVFRLVGGELDGEDVSFFGLRAEAYAAAEAHARTVGASLYEYLGSRAAGVFTPAVPLDELPDYLAEMVREREARLARARGRGARAVRRAS